MKKLFVICFVLMIFDGSAFGQNYNMKFIYGIGSIKDSKALMFYELIDNGGKPSEKIPLSVTDNHSEMIRIKRNTYQEIRFSGYFYSENENISRNILLVSKAIPDLKKGKNETNMISVIGAVTEEGNITPLPELINQISQARYNELLRKDKNDLIDFDYSNIRPIGRFIIYDPISGNVKDAFVMPQDNPIFIESSKKISDHFVLKKKQGVSFNIAYAKLAGVTTDNDKQQFIEYLVSIDTLQVQHWQSKKSEMQFLFESANENKLDFLKNEFTSNSDLKFFFISSCIRIKDFLLKYETHDSIGSVTTANLDIPLNGTNLTIRGGVVYALKVGSRNEDKTNIFYTAFGIRDYTSYLKGIFGDMNINAKITEANTKLQAIQSSVKSQFNDLRLADESLINFENINMIVGFIGALNEKEFRTKSDTLSFDEKNDCDIFNSKALIFNTALTTLKNTITDFSNQNAYLSNLLAEKNNSSGLEYLQPAVIRVPDDKIVGIFKNKTNPTVAPSSTN